jgi:glutamate racemase
MSPYIGVFDSGVGGLTVLKALRTAFPAQSFLYLGDTARVPYGTKSPKVVTRYALEALDFFLTFPLKGVVVACNTASSVALPTMQERVPDLPIYGVIEPAVQYALTYNPKKVVVLATEATVKSHSYRNALLQQDPEMKVEEIPCPLFVPLVEEGILSGKVLQAVLEHYLHPLRENPPDLVILGCTHYPLLKPQIQSYLGEKIPVIDSATPLAVELRKEIPATEGEGEVLFFTTDDPEKFSLLGSRFLNEPIPQVKLLDLQTITR